LHQEEHAAEIVAEKFSVLSMSGSSASLDLAATTVN